MKYNHAHQAEEALRVELAGALRDMCELVAERPNDPEFCMSVCISARVVNDPEALIAGITRLEESLWSV